MNAVRHAGTVRGQDAVQIMETRGKDSRRKSAPGVIRRGVLEVATGNKRRASSSAGDEAFTARKGGRRGNKSFLRQSCLIMEIKR